MQEKEDTCTHIQLIFNTRPCAKIYDLFIEIHRPLGTNSEINNTLTSLNIMILLMCTV